MGLSRESDRKGSCGLMVKEQEFEVPRVLPEPHPPAVTSSLSWDSPRSCRPALFQLALWHGLPPRCWLSFCWGSWGWLGSFLVPLDANGGGADQQVALLSRSRSWTFLAQLTSSPVPVSVPPVPLCSEWVSWLHKLQMLTEFPGSAFSHLHLTHCHQPLGSKAIPEAWPVSSPATTTCYS